jgi:pimeloyl-ACP methyl ester carboxylesterase
MVSTLRRRFTVKDTTRERVELAWDRWGQRNDAPLVLVHGFSGSSSDFAERIPELAPHVPVVCLDHRGHGLSTKLRASEAYSLRRLETDLETFLDTSVGGSAHLLGHSMGGRLCLRLALRRPDLVRSLILQDTTAWSFRNPNPAIAAFLRVFLARFDPRAGLPQHDLPSPERPLLEARTSPAFRRLHYRRARGFDPHAFKALAHELSHHTADGDGDRLGDLQIPVTVMVGERDRPYASHAPRLADRIPNSTLAVIAGAYHAPQLTHPAAWTEVVFQHLTRALSG